MGILTRQSSRSDEAKPQTMDVRCLSSDYDGTISPLNVSREESRVPLETRVMLRQVSRFLPVSIVTMKDLPFVMARTPFAQAWSALGGLEMRIGHRVLKRKSLEDESTSVSVALSYARTHISAAGVEIEEKHDSEGRTVAFCVDWRRAEESRIATREAEKVAAYSEALKLKLIRYETQPFYDVYPVAPDKGWALQEMLGELAVKNGVMYLGDSWMDNSAFRSSGISVGVVHEETPLEALDCDYFVKFEHVSDFLNIVLANNLVFSSDFPMIEANRYRQKAMATEE